MLPLLYLLLTPFVIAAICMARRRARLLRRIRSGQPITLFKDGHHAVLLRRVRTIKLNRAPVLPAPTQEDHI